MFPDRVSNPGPLTYESGVLPIALRGPATLSLSASIRTPARAYELSDFQTVCMTKPVEFDEYYAAFITKEEN